MILWCRRVGSVVVVTGSVFSVRGCVMVSVGIVAILQSAFHGAGVLLVVSVVPAMVVEFSFFPVPANF